MDGAHPFRQQQINSNSFVVRRVPRRTRPPPFGIPCTAEMFVFGLFFAFSVGCDTCANCRDGRGIVIEIIKFRCQRFADGDEAKIVRFASWQRRVWLPCLFRRQSKHATSDLLSIISTMIFVTHPMECEELTTCISHTLHCASLFIGNSLCY